MKYVEFLFLFFIKHELVLFITMKNTHINNAVQLGFETLTRDVETSNLKTNYSIHFFFFFAQHVHLTLLSKRHYLTITIQFVGEYFL